MQGMSQSDLDENDLIDIYDYANDVNDEFIQLEVILNAVRYYPESDELTQRRAYFLLDNLSMNESAEIMAKKHSHETALWDILTLLIQHPDIETAEKGFTEILHQYSGYDDETIIQFVESAAELGLYDWLWSHKAEIQKRCEFPDTFLYELSQEAYERSDFDHAVKALDELTSSEPFNASYWHMLSQAYIHLDNYQEALQAIEYALAIEPTSADLLVTKAQILFDMKNNRKEAIDIILNLYISNPDNSVVCHTLVAMNLILNNVEEAQNVLSSYIMRHPDDAEAVEHSMMLPDPAFSILCLKKYLKTTKLEEPEWMSWANSNFDNGNYRQCADILLAWLYENDSMPEWSKLIESLYRQNRISEIVALYRNYVSNNILAVDPSALSLLLAVFIKTGNRSEALTLANYIKYMDIDKIKRADRRVTALGTISIARQVINSLNSGADASEVFPCEL